MERDVHRRGLALAPHVYRGGARSLLPGDLRFAGGERAADVVGDLVGKGRVGVDRPAAEIERVDVVRDGKVMLTRTFETDSEALEWADGKRAAREAEGLIVVPLAAADQARVV